MNERIEHVIREVFSAVGYTAAIEELPGGTEIAITIRKGEVSETRNFARPAAVLDILGPAKVWRGEIRKAEAAPPESGEATE